MKINIGNMLTERARRDPELEAVVDVASGLRLSYSALDARTNQVAHALCSLDVKPGDRVGLLMMNGVEFVESFFGVAKSGLVNVPLNWRLVADELEFLLSDSGTKVLLYSEEFTEVTTELRARGTTAVQHWIQVGGQPPKDVLDYDPFVATGSADPFPISGFDDDLLFIMYTSGTTGLPKGVMHSHSTIMWMVFSMHATLEFGRNHRYLMAMPLFHAGGLSPLISNLYAGATVVVMRAFDPVAAWKLIEGEQITTGLLVPAMLQFMWALPEETRGNYQSLRLAISAGAPVPTSMLKNYSAIGIEIVQAYGMTETGCPGCAIDSESAVSRAGSTGKANFFGDVRIVDADGKDVPAGQPGEVLLKGPYVMLGYWNRPEATAETIVDGWLHTGDAGTMDENGFVTIVDRYKDMLISGGENIYPAEIENVLLGHPKIAEAGVVGIPSAKWGESPLAAIVRKDESLTAEEVIEFSKSKLASFKSVKAVEFVDELPRNPTGKILKRELRKQFAYDASE